MKTKKARSPNRPGTVWYEFHVKLASYLPPEQLRERLTNAMPRFNVRTGQRVDGLSFSGTYSSLWLHDGTFAIVGPRRFGLDVRGSIERSQEGLRIQLTASNGMSFCIAAIVWFAGIFVGVGISVPPPIKGVDILGTIVAFGVGGVVGGFLIYFVRSIRARTYLDELIDCLKMIFVAERIG